MGAGQLGAQHTIDYKREDFTRTGNTYDLIIDVKSTRSIFDYRRALNPGGKCVLVGGALPWVLTNAIAGVPSTFIGNKHVGVLLHKANGDLDIFGELYGDGKVQPVIDKTYPLVNISDAFQRFGEAQQIGKSSSLCKSHSVTPDYRNTCTDNHKYSGYGAGDEDRTRDPLHATSCMRLPHTRRTPRLNKQIVQKEKSGYQHFMIESRENIYGIFTTKHSLRG